MKELNVNLTYLKYFCDTVRLGSLAASSKANFVTQSAISQSISKLEKYVGIQLVAHHPNRFRLTPQGEAFFIKAMDFLKITGEFQQSISANDFDSLGKLEFASTYSFAISILPIYLKRFHDDHPQIQMSFQLDRNVNVKQMVKQGVVDFGILPDDGTLSDFNKQDIYLGEYKFYISAHLAKNERNNLSLVMGKFRGNDKAFLQESLKKNDKEHSIMEVSSWELVANMVHQGMAIGYLPDYIAVGKEDILSEIDFGLAPLPYRISAISPMGMRLRKSSEVFLSYILNKVPERLIENIR